MLLVMLSCKESSVNPDTNLPDSFIFGTSYGMCLGDCAHFFMLRDSKVYPDDITIYTGNNLKFSDTALDASKYVLAARAQSNFPDFFKLMTDSTLGCPDCRDQGAYHIIITKNSITRTYHIDPFYIDNFPALQKYFADIDSIMAKLEE